MVLATYFDTRVLPQFPGVSLLLELALSYTPTPGTPSVCLPQTDSSVTPPRPPPGMERGCPVSTQPNTEWRSRPPHIAENCKTRLFTKQFASGGWFEIKMVIILQMTVAVFHKCATV